MSRAHLFGVRHHSPQAARLVRTLIADVAPAAVLVEGPADFNAQLGELTLEHRLPIAIYASVVTDGQRRAASHPFCSYSPEWQALRAAHDHGAQARFIDLPWAEIADPDEEHVHRYGDQELRRSPVLPELCRRLGVDGFDDAWDLLVEVDPALTLETYRARVDALGEELRDDEAAVSAQDARREAFMVAEVHRALGELEGDVVVVTGAFHTAALRHGLAEPARSPQALSAAEPGDGRVLALTPYSYAALDALTGYEAGMPNPGFYELVWRAREGSSERAPADAALELVVARLRAVDQLVSPADLIAVRTTAEGLALLRGHPEVWRRDLVDAILGALVKDELEVGLTHPMLEACFEVLRGDAVGALAEGARRPPFVADLEARLERLELVAGARPLRVELELRDARDLERSRLLHAALVLELPGVTAQDVVARPEDGTVRERWELRRRSQLAGAAIEAAAYGATVPAAVAGRLLELAGRLDRDAAAATALHGAAVLAGADGVAAPLRRRVLELVATDPVLANAGAALATLLHLYRYEPVLGTTGDAGVGELLEAAWRRVLWLLDPGGGSVPPADAGIEAIARVVEAHERCGAALGLERDELVAVLERLAGDEAPEPGLRGAALGAAWVLDAVDQAALDRAPLAFADPASLGDFLFGLFRTAREAAQRRPDLLRAVDGLVAGFDDGAYLEALPALRRAFSAFSPREKDRMARLVLGEALPAVRTDVDLVALAQLESALRGAVERFGLRGAP